MNVVCVQFDMAWEEREANHAKVEAMLAGLPPAERSLVLLPEMFSTGFSMNVKRISDSAAGATQRFLGEMAAKFRVYLLGGVVTTAEDGRGRNEAALFSPAGQEIARYQKLHPFTYGGEARHYAPGAAVVTAPLEGFTFCPFICYDLRFPEAFRRAVRRGANLFAVIANWPASREHHWVTLLQARAIENQAYVAAVNRCGADPRLAYSGRSMIIDPRGKIMVDAGTEEKIISAELDLAGVEGYRKEFPVLGDMRGDLLGL